MSQVSQRTITIRYSPAPRSIIYEKRHLPLNAAELHELIRTLNRTRIATIAPNRPKGGEIYVYRSQIIGKSWQNDGYERCWRSNGTHYYPKFGNVQTSKQSALFKVLRHVAVDRDTNQKGNFKRVAFIQLPRGQPKENPLVIVQYFGDESTCSAVNRPHGSAIHGQGKSRSRSRVSTMQLAAEIEAPVCEVVDHMDIGDEASAAVVVPVPGPVSLTLDEDLREASALGDIDRVAALLASGAGVSSGNPVNGWTALHWAAKRGHAQVASLLLGRGADPAARNAAGQTPGDLAGCDKLIRLLGAGTTTQPRPQVSVGGGGGGAFVPNYLRNPEFPYARASASASSRRRRSSTERQEQQLPEQKYPLLLQVRVANSDDPDFIEVELSNPSYEALVELLCQELSLEPASLERIRKLPNVRLRNDRDVARLQSGQQLELVLRDF